MKSEKKPGSVGRTEPSQELDQLAREVIGTAIEVHSVLGPGYLESVYEEAMSIELGLRGIPFARQSDVAVSYKGRQAGKGTVDFLINGMLVVELKAVSELAPVHQAQVISYLKATGCKLGLLINFNVALLKEGIRRIVLS